jgi:hypothetical protein
MAQALKQPAGPFFRDRERGTLGATGHLPPHLQRVESDLKHPAAARWVEMPSMGPAHDLQTAAGAWQILPRISLIRAVPGPASKRGLGEPGLLGNGSVVGGQYLVTEVIEHLRLQLAYPHKKPAAESQ